MFHVTIRNDDDLAGGEWEVSATTPGGAVDDNPFRDRNDDWPLGETIARALDLAMHELHDPTYVLAVAICLCRTAGRTHREGAEAELLAAVDKYIEAVNPKDAHT